MLTAHLPSGYVLARGLGWPERAVFIAALVGAVLPDFDMLWFHLVDHGSIHHHRYWPHIPAVWATIAGPTIWLAARVGHLRLALAFFAGIAAHLVLDSISGGVLWGWPISDRLLSLVEVPATRSHWVWSFVFHWTFLLELAIWGAAGWLLLSKRKRV